MTPRRPPRLAWDLKKNTTEGTLESSLGAAVSTKLPVNLS